MKRRKASISPAAKNNYPLISDSCIQETIGKPAKETQFGTWDSCVADLGKIHEPKDGGRSLQVDEKSQGSVKPDPVRESVYFSTYLSR